jgi:hypothetical protein
MMGSGHMLPDPTAKHVDFEKMLSTYSSKMLEQEANRKQVLETKAQFYLTLISAFLTAIYFSLPYVNVLQNIVHRNTIPSFWKVTITGLLIAAGIAIFCSLLAILQVMLIQNYRSEYPLPPSSLLVPGSDTFEADDEASFLHFTTRVALEALEHNRNRNNKKWLWAKRISYCVLCTVILLFCLLGLSIYLQIYFVSS